MPPYYVLRFVAPSDRILRKMHNSNGKFVSRELNLMNESEQVSLNLHSVFRIYRIFKIHMAAANNIDEMENIASFYLVSLSMKMQQCQVHLIVNLIHYCLYSKFHKTQFTCF